MKLVSYRPHRQWLARYEVRFAQNAEELDAVLKLRFNVFNLKLGEGLEESYSTQRDQGEFDARCHHLIVMDKKNQEVLGTYRKQTHEMAAAHGFYSAREFDLTAFGPPAIDRRFKTIGYLVMWDIAALDQPTFRMFFS